MTRMMIPVQLNSACMGSWAMFADDDFLLLMLLFFSDDEIMRPSSSALLNSGARILLIGHVEFARFKVVLKVS